MHTEPTTVKAKDPIFLPGPCWPHYDGEHKGTGQRAKAKTMTSAKQRYEKAMSRIRSAIEFMRKRRVSSISSITSLRVGINSAKFEQCAMAQLLISKGLITSEEYEEVLAVAAEEEAEATTEQARRECGLPDIWDFA